jgi:NadR type nicotinamide-nucleotide adenylyltransferase
LKKDNNIIRIALIGPESSGKTSLCEWLAKEFNTIYVKEYSREYLNNLDHEIYTKSDVVNIYKQQHLNEMDLIDSANQILFTDTEVINAKVWLEHKFSESDLWLEEQITRYPYDLYLLTKPDLRWEPDPLRENPDKGMYFFDQFKQLLEKYELNYKVIEGSGEQRFENAYQTVSRFQNSKSVK